MKLTQREIAPSLGYQDLVHVVLINDTTQDANGSSYKSTIQQIIDLAPKDSFVTGGTHNIGSGVTTFMNSTGTTFDVNGYFKPSDDVYVTGGTYSNSTGTITFQNNKEGVFQVDGFFKQSDDIYVTGTTFNPSNYELVIERNDDINLFADLSILASDVKVTGGTYNPSNGVATFTNNSGGTFNVTGFLTGFTDTFVTGGTYNAGTATFTNTAGNVFNVTGFFTGSTTENLQKQITTDYTVSSGDNNYTILVNNNGTPIIIDVPAGLMSKINVGFIQQGTGDVTFRPIGTTINSPLNMVTMKGQNYWAYLEQVTNTNVYHLIGSLKL